jgi:predicted RNA binding protein YcfA (HicA-like mRNA interferase family)
MRAVPTRDLIKALQAIGARPLQTRGSHQRWQLGSCTTTIVVAKREAAPGTMRSIEADLAPCAGSKRWLRDQLGQ